MNRQERPLVVVLGGINMDLVTLAPRFPEAGETIVGTEFLTYPGGKGANQALAAARTGARVAMVGRIGNRFPVPGWCGRHRSHRVPGSKYRHCGHKH